MDSLENRLVRLERAVYAWRLFAVAVATLLVAVFSLGQAAVPAKVLEAERIFFRDSAGTVRMELRGAPADGKVIEWYGLMFYNEEGEESARVRMSGNTLEIQMKGSERDALRVLDELQKKQRMTDEMRALFIAEAKQRGGELAVLNPKGLSVMHGPGASPTAGVSVWADEISVSGGSIKVKDMPRGQSGTVIGKHRTKNKKSGAITTHSAASVLLFDEEGSVIFQAP